MDYRCYNRRSTWLHIRSLHGAWYGNVVHDELYEALYGTQQTGDSFVAFGGNAEILATRNDMLIYNLKTNEWTDQFYLNTPHPPSPPPSFPKITATTATTTTTMKPTVGLPTTESYVSITAITSAVQSSSGFVPPVPKPSGMEPPSDNTKGVNVPIIGGTIAGAVIVPIVMVFVYRRYISKYRGSSSGQPAHDNYGGKKYKDAERIHSQESLEDQKDSQQHQNFPLETTKRTARDNKKPYGHRSPSFPPPLPAAYSSGSPTLFSSPSTISSHTRRSDTPALTASTPRAKTYRPPQDYSQNQMHQEQKHEYLRDPQRHSIMTASQQTWDHQQQQSRNPQYSSPSLQKNGKNEQTTSSPLAPQRGTYQDSQLRRGPQRHSNLSSLQETWEYQHERHQSPQYHPTPSLRAQSIVPYPPSTQS
ncbi:hypothetical protein BGZ51_003111 [Haplosporangium sp. Z 767]|nr:hypothetical protein BGZ51_003111 [Haplosporangium sp. Z 767]